MNIQRANIVELAANAARTSTLTGTGVDIRKYAGYGQVVLQSSAGTGTNPTLNVKLQHADTVGGSYTDITGAVFAEVTDAADSTQMIQLPVDEVKPFIKVIGTIAGTDTPTFSFGVSLVAISKAGRNASQAV